MGLDCGLAIAHIAIEAISVPSSKLLIFLIMASLSGGPTSGTIIGGGTGLNNSFSPAQSLTLGMGGRDKTPLRGQLNRLKPSAKIPTRTTTTH
jgi:hypothetical protein